MKPTLLVMCAALVLVATPAVGQKVYVDHHDATDFSRFSTFAYVDAEDNLKETDPLVHDRVVAAIRAQLVAVGMEEVEDNPQLSVTYHASEKEETRINSTHTDLVWGSSLDRGSPGVSRTDSNVITSCVGTLVIDIVESEEENLVWRGTAPGVLAGNPRKKAKRVNRAIERLAGEWRRMQGGG